MSQNVSSAAVVIGAVRVKALSELSILMQYIVKYKCT